MIGYKLVTQRKDGSIGPLFINRKQRLPLGLWLAAEDHPTKGFKHRPGWHVMREKNAPHLKEEGRVWAKVKICGVTEETRPASQGGVWYLAEYMMILELL